jgi:hypothetical protein
VTDQEPLYQPSKKPSRKLFKALVWTLSVPIVLAGGLLALLYFSQDRVKAVILSELNGYLNAEVRVAPEDIDLTIISTFPDCSIRFKNVVMFEAIKSKKRDTLLFAERVNLHFNIKNIWNGKYEIEKVKLRDGFAKPVIYRNGSNNYTFWKQSTGKTNDSLSFSLNELSVENFTINYQDRSSRIATNLLVRKTLFSGEFSRDEYSMRSVSELLINEVRSDSSVYLKNKDLKADVDLIVKGNEYALTAAEVKLNDLMLHAKGNLVYSDSLEMADVKFNAPDLDISQLLSLLPARLKGRMNDYKSGGAFNVEGSFLWAANKKKYDLVVNLGVRNGNITHIESGTSVEKLNVGGKLIMSDKSSSLQLKGISATILNDEISGECSVKDFNDPYLTVDLKSRLDLRNLISFWPIDTVSELKGKISLEGNAEGLLSDFRSRVFSDKVKLDLMMNVESLQVQFVKDPRTYNLQTCSLSAKNRDIMIHNAELKRGETDLKLSGHVPGIFNYLLDRTAPLIITGKLESKKVDLEDFLFASGNGGTTSPLIPLNLDCRLDASIERLQLGKFIASKLNGNVEIRNGKAIFNDIKFESMNGDVELNAFVDNTHKRLDLAVQSRLGSINIRELFYEFNNFGQATLEDRNVKGYMTADVDFSGSWNEKLEVIPASMIADCRLNIERGELIGFKPLASLSRFISLEELENIRFSTLTSSLSIRNRVINISRTALKNSALNLEVWGSHDFDNRIDYHFQLLMSELLAKKRKRTNDEEFGIVENDPDNRRCAYILMTGTVDDPKIRYDKKGFREKVREDIRKEKQDLKKMIREELNVFRGGSQPDGRAQKDPGTVIAKEATPKKNVELKRKDEDEDF